MPKAKFSKAVFNTSVLIYNDDENPLFPVYTSKVTLDRYDNVIKASDFYPPIELSGIQFHQEWDRHIQEVYKKFRGTSMEICKDNGELSNFYTYK